MNQTNNNFDLTIEEINTLYDISKRLKESFDERVSVKKVLAKNPSSGMYQRHENAKLEYQKALQDFNYWISNFVFLKENKINELSKERLVEYIQNETVRVINEYFKNNKKEEEN